MIARTLQNKIIAANYHGGRDFYAGVPCDQKIPLAVYHDLTEAEQELIMSAYVKGWKEQEKESQMEMIA